MSRDSKDIIRDARIYRQRPRSCQRESSRVYSWALSDCHGDDSSGSRETSDWHMSVNYYNELCILPCLSAVSFTSTAAPNRDIVFPSMTSTSAPPPPPGPGGFGTVSYAPDEYQSVHQMLHMQLGPEFVSTRSGPGGSASSEATGISHLCMVTLRTHLVLCCITDTPRLV